MPATHLAFSAKEFNELAVESLYALLRLRNEVFVVEQKCIYGDLDGYDEEAVHILGRDFKNKVRAYARILRPHIDYFGTKSGNVRVGRVIIDQSLRGQNFGMKLMEYVLQEIQTRFGDTHIEMSAQAHLENFYKKLGFMKTGDPYDETGIPHIRMISER